MVSNHMRMRPQWPMLTTSDTAPMVQKLALLATAPKTKASAKPPHSTMLVGSTASFTAGSRAGFARRRGGVAGVR